MEEEAAAMEKFRASASTSNPFAAAPPAGAEEAPNILDLFGVASPAQAQPGRARSGQPVFRPYFLLLFTFFGTQKIPF